MNEHTSLELSQRLHEKGFRGEHDAAWFYHHIYSQPHDKRDWELLNVAHPAWEFEQRAGDHEVIPAYTFTELWGVLPREVKRIGFKFLDTTQHKDMLINNAGYSYWVDSERTYFAHESPTEAIALLLIWLIENGHMEVSK